MAATLSHIVFLINGNPAHHRALSPPLPQSIQIPISSIPQVAYAPRKFYRATEVVLHMRREHLCACTNSIFIKQHPPPLQWLLSKNWRYIFYFPSGSSFSWDPRDTPARFWDNLPRQIGSNCWFGQGQHRGSLVRRAAGNVPQHVCTQKRDTLWRWAAPFTHKGGRHRHPLHCLTKTHPKRGCHKL